LAPFLARFGGSRFVRIAAADDHEVAFVAALTSSLACN
jgi:hypothetical protein